MWAKLWHHYCWYSYRWGLRHTLLCAAWLFLSFHIFKVSSPSVWYTTQTVIKKSLKTLHAALELITLNIHKRGLALHSVSKMFQKERTTEPALQRRKSWRHHILEQQSCQLNPWKLAQRTKRFQELVELFSDADCIRELPHVIVDDSLIVVQETIFNIIQTINIFCWRVNLKHKKYARLWVYCKQGLKQWKELSLTL